MNRQLSQLIEQRSKLEILRARMFVMAPGKVLTAVESLSDRLWNELPLTAESGFEPPKAMLDDFMEGTEELIATVDEDLVRRRRR